MRYFTKEWYNNTLVAQMCFQLRKTEKAAKYSDKFYERLYTVEEKAYIRYRKRELKAMRQSSSVEQLKEEFRQNTETNLEFVKNNLPNEILSEIADIRILALGSVTSAMYDKITRYCGKVNGKCESAKRAYEEACEEAFEAIDPKTAKIISDLPDAEIISINKNGDDLILELSSDYADITVTLKGGSQAEENTISEACFVIKSELILNDDKKFEFSLLCIANSLNLYTFSFIADAVSAHK